MPPQYPGLDELIRARRTAGPAEAIQSGLEGFIAGRKRRKEEEEARATAALAQAKEALEARRTAATEQQALASERRAGAAETTAEAALKRAERGPTPPKGYRYTPDETLEPIPGGPEARKIQAAQQKELGLQQSSVEQADRIIAKVDQVSPRISEVSAGLGSLTSIIPRTPARNLQVDIDTIKANLGFKELQEMRRNSPTGGALGQIAVRELDFLQSTVASLDPGQSPTQLKRNLGEIRASMERWKEAVLQDRAQQGATTTITAPPPASGVVPPPAGTLSDAEKAELAALRAQKGQR